MVSKKKVMLMLRHSFSMSLTITNTYVQSILIDVTYLGVRFEEAGVRPKFQNHLWKEARCRRNVDRYATLHSRVQMRPDRIIPSVEAFSAYGKSAFACAPS